MDKKRLQINIFKGKFISIDFYYFVHSACFELILCGSRSSLSQANWGACWTNEERRPKSKVDLDTVSSCFTNAQCRELWAKEWLSSLSVSITLPLSPTHPLSESVCDWVRRRDRKPSHRVDARRNQVKITLWELVGIQVVDNLFKTTNSTPSLWHLVRFLLQSSFHEEGCPEQTPPNVFSLYWQSSSNQYVGVCNSSSEFSNGKEIREVPFISRK